jgi:hypothetical protein
MTFRADATLIPTGVAKLAALAKQGFHAECENEQNKK